MNIDEYLDDLKNKYNYSNDLINLLKKIIPSIVLYYGEDKKELILSAIEDTEIHFQKEDEEMYGYLNNYFSIKNKWNIPNNGAAFMENEYVLMGNVIRNKNLIYIKQVIYGDYIPFDFNNSICISNLVHEICHLVKSYGTINYVDGKLMSRSGIIKEYYKCNINNGLLVLYENKNTGLEEALNTIDEENIINLLSLDYNKYTCYNEMADKLKPLLENDIIKDIFMKSEFGEDLWLDYFKEDGLSLSKLFDDWLRLIYTPADIAIFDDKYQDKINDIKNNINNIIDKYSKNNLKS